MVLVLLSLPLFQEGLLEVFGKNAANARLREISGFEDAALTGLLQQLKDELRRRREVDRPRIVKEIEEARAHGQGSRGEIAREPRAGKSRGEIARGNLGPRAAVYSAGRRQ